jgi:hypothetical protein
MIEAAYVLNRSGDASDESINKGMLVFVFLNSAFNMGKGFSAEISGFYGGQKTGYVETDPTATLSAGIRKSLLKDKLMITLNVNDIFNSASPWISSKYRNVNLRAFEDTDRRSVTLSFRYSFGSKTVKASRRRTSGIEDETARTQNEKTK